MFFSWWPDNNSKCQNFYVSVLFLAWQSFIIINKTLIFKFHYSIMLCIQAICCKRNYLELSYGWLSNGYLKSPAISPDMFKFKFSFSSSGRNLRFCHWRSNFAHSVTKALNASHRWQQWFLLYWVSTFFIMGLQFPPLPTF